MISIYRFGIQSDDCVSIGFPIIVLRIYGELRFCAFRLIGWMDGYY